MKLLMRLYGYSYEDHILFGSKFANYNLVTLYEFYLLGVVIHNVTLSIMSFLFTFLTLNLVRYENIST